MSKPCCQRVNHMMIFRDISQGKNASWVANTVHTRFWLCLTGLHQREVTQPASTHLWCCFHSWKSPLQLGIQKNWYCLHQCQLPVGARCKNCVSYNQQVECHSTVCYSTPAAQYLPPPCNPRNQAIEIFHWVIFCVRSDVLMVTSIKTVVFWDNDFMCFPTKALMFWSSLQSPYATLYFHSTPAAQYLPPPCNLRNQAIEIFHWVIFCVRSDVLMVTSIKTVVFWDNDFMCFPTKAQMFCSSLLSPYATL